MADINIGAISEALNDKVDLDLLNIDPVPESIGRIASWAMPISDYEIITLGASGTEYTATNNGYIYVHMDRTSNDASLHIISSETGMSIKGTTNPNSSTDVLVAYLPVKTGQKYVINYHNATSIYARFIPVGGDGEGQGGSGGSTIYSGGGFPDYSKGEAITTPYIIKKDGWVFWNASTAQGPQYLYVNDILVAQVAALGANDTTSYTATIPVFKGDNVRWGEGSAVYYPLKDNDYLGNRNIGTIIKTLIPQTDAGLHLLDGAVIQGDGIYEEFVNHMASLYGDGTNIPNYFTSESNWQYSVTTYGCCGKFVYDSENNTIRLPKFERILQGTLLESELGDRIEAGAPNISGQVGTSDNATTPQTGAFYSSGAIGHGNGSGGAVVVQMDASHSSSIYGNSDTIQPPVIKVLYYIVIATSKKTDVEVNIDNIANDLDRKADKDLVNTGYITNCITEIPQDIKVECNNGTLTLKAGSKVYYPDGFESDGTTKKFSYIVIQRDITTVQPPKNSTNLFIYVSQNGNSLGWRDISGMESGNVEPATGSGITYYNTDNNTLIAHNSSAPNDVYTCFPLCSVTCVNGTGITKINQVFNGFGYIGATLFALPGLKGLIPNGRNEDGTLKNIRFQTTEVMIATEDRDTVKYIVIGYNDGQWQGDGRISSFVNNNYDEVSNYNYDRTGNIQPVFRVGKCSFSNGKFTQISKKEALHVVDMNDKESIDVSALLVQMCDKIWPVNSIYIGNTNTCPIAAIVGTWTKVSSGRVIQGSDGSHSAGSTIAAGLPNITGDIGRVRSAEPASSATDHTTGAFKNSTQGENKITNYSGGEIDNTPRYKFDASLSNSIYGNSTTVQPPAYVVNIWCRTA